MQDRRRGLPVFIIIFLANLDASVPEQLQRGPDVGLQLVLHTRQTQELHLPLQALHHRCYLQASVVDAELRLVVAILHKRKVETQLEQQNRSENRKYIGAPSIPQSPGTAPQTEISWPPPASSGLLWPCSHTEGDERRESDVQLQALLETLDWIWGFGLFKINVFVCLIMSFPPPKTN